VLTCSPDLAYSATCIHIERDRHPVMPTRLLAFCNKYSKRPSNPRNKSIQFEKPTMTVHSTARTPVEVPWSRLIRFVGEDGQTHFGDAIVPNSDFDIGATANLPLLKAKLITGNPLSPDCTVTDKVVKVQKLLGPLTSSMVPAVRCIGGNYGAHRTFIEVGISGFMLIRVQSRN
jgi:hypothetical protein